MGQRRRQNQRQYHISSSESLASAGIASVGGNRVRSAVRSAMVKSSCSSLKVIASSRLRSTVHDDSRGFPIGGAGSRSGGSASGGVIKSNFFYTVSRQLRPCGSAGGGVIKSKRVCARPHSRQEAATLRRREKWSPRHAARLRGRLKVAIGRASAQRNLIVLSRRRHLSPAPCAFAVWMSQQRAIQLHRPSRLRAQALPPVGAIA
jgi:hypothetical protein